MSVTSVASKIDIRGNENKDRSGYMTTTELSRLCGVSRFTIINWIKRGKIKVIRTVGNHYRIPESEAVSLLDTIEEEQKDSTDILEKHCVQENTKQKSKEKCGICLKSNKKKRRLKPKKNNVLYAFGYSVGRSVHALKGRSKVK